MQRQLPRLLALINAFRDRPMMFDPNANPLLSGLENAWRNRPMPLLDAVQNQINPQSQALVPGGYQSQTPGYNQEDLQRLFNFPATSSQEGAAPAASSYNMEDMGRLAAAVNQPRAQARQAIAPQIGRAVNSFGQQANQPSGNGQRRRYPSVIGPNTGPPMRGGPHQMKGY